MSNGLLERDAALRVSERILGTAAKLIQEPRRLDEVFIEILDELGRHAVTIRYRHRADLGEDLVGVSGLVHPG